MSGSDQLPQTAEGQQLAETPPLAAGQIEIWKKIIDVQQHFNDLELRVRNFALIITGAFLGLGGYAIKDGGSVVAALVVLSAVLPLSAFYFMDRFWYHRLLDGAVAAGAEAEAELQVLGYKVALGSKISAASPFTFKVGRFSSNVRSKRKMDIFYALLLLSLVIVAGFLGFGFRPQTPSSAQGAPTGNAASVSQVAPSSALAGGAAASATSAAKRPDPAPQAASGAQSSSAGSTAAGSQAAGSQAGASLPRASQTSASQTAASSAAMGRAAASAEMQPASKATAQEGSKK